MEAMLIAGTLAVAWSFCVWALVLALKTLVRVSKFEPAIIFWDRTKELAPLIFGALTGLFSFPLILALAGIDVAGLPPEIHSTLPGAGSFLGIGAGSVASKCHDVGLGRIEDLLRRDKG